MERSLEGEPKPAEEQTSVEQLVQLREEEWCFGMVGQCSQPGHRALLWKADIRYAQFDS